MPIVTLLLPAYKDRIIVCNGKDHFFRGGKNLHVNDRVARKCEKINSREKKPLFKVDWTVTSNQPAKQNVNGTISPAIQLELV